MEYIWVSDNGRWVIDSVKEEFGLTVAWVIDRHKTSGKRGFEVEVHHIKEGQELMYGDIAKETYDHFVSDSVVPKYVQSKILELSPIKRKEG